MTKVLFFGDSHTRCYISQGADLVQEELDFTTCVVDGATAQGAVNPHSKTKALSSYRAVLKKRINEAFDYFGIMLGEVDCGFVIWHRAKKYKKTVSSQIDLAVGNLETFLNEDVEKNFTKKQIVVVGATLPTIQDNADIKVLKGARGSVTANLSQRMNCTFRYNEKLKKMAESNGYRYFDVSEETLDKPNNRVYPRFLRSDPEDHHFNSKAAGPLFADKFKEAIQ